jgi:hypothetical protein
MDTSKLCEQNQEHKYEIVELREKILVLEAIIKENEKEIWKKCKHDWAYDITSGQYERNCYYCKKCKLWKNGRLYV